jgi:hypothetical protein
MVPLNLVHAADLIHLMNTELHSIVTFILLYLFLLEITLRQISGRISFCVNLFKISEEKWAVGGNTVALALALCHDSTYSADVDTYTLGQKHH